MALDAANFISELSITDPPGSDPLSQGDDQLRTCKRSVFNSFRLIDKAVDITADQMNLMAIKNEANVFTAEQTIQDNGLVFNADADVGIPLTWKRSALLRWQLSMTADGSNNDWSLARFDDLGDFLDLPIQADRATGVINFPHVPTIAGDPIWTPGEIKMLVIGSTPPSNNWFSATGTNGTVDLRNRLFAMSDSFSGPRAPFIDLQIDPGVISGSTVLTVAQTPSHRHTVLTGINGSGITDTTLAFSSTVDTDTVIAGNRQNSNAFLIDDNNNNVPFMSNVGGGAGHTHTIPEAEVDIPGNDAFQIMPYSYHFLTVQYVP